MARGRVAGRDGGAGAATVGAAGPDAAPALGGRGWVWASGAAALPAVAPVLGGAGASGGVGRVAGTSAADLAPPTTWGGRARGRTIANSPSAQRPARATSGKRRGLVRVVATAARSGDEAIGVSESIAVGGEPMRTVAGWPA